jgi:hypothetical protein
VVGEHGGSPCPSGAGRALWRGSGHATTPTTRWPGVAWGPREGGGQWSAGGLVMTSLVLVSLLGLAPSCAGHATPFPSAVCCCQARRGGAGSARSGQKGIQRNHLGYHATNWSRVDPIGEEA